jgi:outer membrane protein TolC
LNERINQLYFSCLLQDELLKQNNILQKELQINMDRIIALINSGVANESDRESFEVELLNTCQREIELKANREAYVLMLGILIGKEVNEQTVFILPSDPLAGRFYNSQSKVSYPRRQEVNHPELRVLEAKEKLIYMQNMQINAGLMPKIGLFIQGGYGRPGLNMLEDSFEPFYIAGIRFSWNIGRYYTLKNDRKKIEASMNFIKMQREMFILNTSMKGMQQYVEVKKIDNILKTDSKIVNLRANIKKSTEIKLKNGVITITDLIREINAEDLAKRNMAMHNIQRLMSIYNYMYTFNNK